MPAPVPKIYKVFTTPDDRVFYIAKKKVKNPSTDFDLHSGKKQRFDHFFNTCDDLVVTRFVDRLYEKTFSALTKNSEYDYIPVIWTPENGYVVHIAEGIKSVQYRRIINYGFIDLHDSECLVSVDTDRVFKARLRKIIGNVSTKSLTSAFSNTPRLKSWIEDKTKKYSPLNINEMVYIILRNSPEKNECGKYPKFNSYEKGYYQFCGSKTKCKCSRKAGTDYLFEFHKGKDKNYYKERAKRTEATVLDKWGAKNVMHVPSIQKKHEESCIASFGYSKPFLSPDISKKASDTCEKRHGVRYPFQSADVLNKGYQRACSRHGDPFANARQAFRDQNDGKNPFVVYAEEIREAYVIKLGVDHPSKSQEIKDKKNNTLFANYGVNNPAQLHIPPKSLCILDDKEAFTKLCEQYTLYEITEMLEVSPRVVWNRHDRYELGIFPKRVKSRYEEEISEWLNRLGIEYKREQKFGLGNQSLDFVIENRLAIEFNGLYSHSQYSAHGISRKMDRWYHKKKTDQCNKIGYQLLSVFEDEWNNSKELVKGKILTTLGYGERGVAARKTVVKEVTKENADEFLNMYHLQGTTASSVRLGAYYNGKLIALMTFKKDGNKWTLMRFVNDNRSHPGVFSKLLKNFERQHVGDTIVSFSDNRWSKGDVYIKNGFSKVGELKPDYSVTNYIVREHKFNWRKKRIASRFGVEITGKTELVLTRELGYDRIWDCGKIKWMKIAST